MGSKNPFAIIKTKMYSVGHEKSVFEKIYSPSQAFRPISRFEAMKIIDKYDMHIAHRFEDMEIWEMEGNPFYEKYKGYYEHREKVKGL